jgi:hypothetical protein
MRWEYLQGWHWLRNGFEHFFHTLVLHANSMVDRGRPFLSQDGLHNHGQSRRRQPASGYRNYHHLLRHQLNYHRPCFLLDGNLWLWLHSWIYP